MPDSLNTLTVVAPTGTTIVQDSSGVQRLQWGKLGAYTDPRGVSSPVEQGIRVLDASGNILFDTIGISQVMSSLGSSAYGSDQVTGSTTPVEVPGSAVIFNLSRPASVLAFAMVSAYMVQNPPIAAGNVVIDSGGLGSSARLRYPFINSSRVSIVQTALLFVPQVPAGRNTWDLKFYVDTTPDSIDINDWHLNVFLLGG